MSRTILFLGLILTCLLSGLGIAFAAPDCVIPDYNQQYSVPPENAGDPKFKLSLAFPTQLPAGPPPWGTHNFENDWQAYLSSVLDQALSELDENLLPKDINGTPRWFHVPWMDGDTHGREFLHGLTKERGPAPQDISEISLPGKQGWAVGVYNSVAGYTLGKVFGTPCNPDLTKALFDPGSASVKFLFTDATPTEIPWLAGTLHWRAHINPPGGNDAREVRDVYLIQVDVAARDVRASDTGWVFGTFVFDSGIQSAPPINWRAGLVPLSIQWGNDPNANAGDPINQSRINTTMQGRHFGWNARPTLGWHGRANGPIDNIVSSCLSCHGSAQYPRSAKYGNFWNPRTPSHKVMTDDQRRLIWFRNIRPGQLFDDTQASTPLDYSLQIQTALERFCNGKGKTITPLPTACSNAQQVLSKLSPLEASELMKPTTRGDAAAQ